MKKLIKIIAGIIVAVVVLVVVIGLLLSIFFPAEKVRLAIEEQGTRILNTEVKLSHLSFSIFNGFELKGLQIAQPQGQWAYPEFAKIQSVRLNYRLWPLLHKEIAVKDCVIESGVVNLEKHKTTSNWSYYLDRIEQLSGNKPKPQPTTEQPKPSPQKKPDITLKSLPINLSVQKAGVDGLTVTFRDDSLYDVPTEAKIKDFKMLLEKINLKQNKPIEIDGGMSIQLSAKDHVDIDTTGKITGNIRVFDEKTGKIAFSGPLNLELADGSFASKDMKPLLTLFTQQLIGSVLGPDVKNVLQNKDFVEQKANAYFAKLSTDVDDQIKQPLEKAKGILAKKDELIKYNNTLSKDMNAKVDSSIQAVDEKFDSIDKKVSPIFETAKKIPMIQAYVKLSEYEKRYQDLKANIENRKKELKSKYGQQLDAKMQQTIADQFPQKIPQAQDFKNRYLELTQSYKAKALEKLKSISFDNLAQKFTPNLAFLDQKMDLKTLATTILLGQKKDNTLDFKTKYFDLNAKYDYADKKVAVNGNLTASLKAFGLSDFFETSPSIPVSVTGPVTGLAIKIDKGWTPKINTDKIKDMAGSFVNNYLTQSFDKDKIVSDVLGKFDIKDVDVNALKAKISGQYQEYIDLLGKDKTGAIGFLDQEGNAIVAELKKKVPMLK